MEGESVGARTGEGGGTSWQRGRQGKTEEKTEERARGPFDKAQTGRHHHESHVQGALLTTAAPTQFGELGQVADAGKVR